MTILTGYATDRETILKSGGQSGTYQFTLGKSYRRKENPQSYVIDTDRSFIESSRFILRSSRLQRISKKDYRFDPVEYEMKYLVLQGISDRSVVSVHMPVIDIRCPDCRSGTDKKYNKSCSKCNERSRSPLLARKDDLVKIANSINMFRERTAHMSYPHIVLEAGPTSNHLGHYASELAVLWNALDKSVQERTGFSIDTMSHRINDFMDIVDAKLVRVVYVHGTDNPVELRGMFSHASFITDPGESGLREEFESVVPTPFLTKPVFEVRDFMADPMLVFVKPLPKPSDFLKRLKEEIEHGWYSGVDSERFILLKSYFPRAVIDNNMIVIKTGTPTLVLGMVRSTIKKLNSLDTMYSSDHGSVYILIKPKSDPKLIMLVIESIKIS